MLKPPTALNGCCYQITFEGFLSYAGGSVGHSDIDITGPQFKSACGDFGGGSIHVGQTSPPAVSPMVIGGTYYVCDLTDFNITVFNGFSSALSGTIFWSIIMVDPAGCP